MARHTGDPDAIDELQVRTALGRHLIHAQLQLLGAFRHVLQAILAAASRLPSSKL